jgi:hypothetical protein
MPRRRKPEPIPAVPAWVFVVMTASLCFIAAVGYVT